MCVRDFAAGEERRAFEGAIICVGCHGGVPDTRTPEHRQRGYSSGGSIGGIKQAIDAAHRRIVKRPPRARETMMPVRDSVEPGHELVRGPRFDSKSGKALDRYESKLSLGDETLIHVATTDRHHVFQKPAPRVDAPANPLSSLEPYRRKA